MRPGIFKHLRCRNAKYPKSDVHRLPVSDEFVFWKEKLDDYNPPLYDSPVIENKPWADSNINDAKFLPKWNSLDGNVNRASHVGIYEIIGGYPINPFGRTGLCGRGLLGRWGPNHAADPIVSKWKRHENGDLILNSDSGKKILQICAIERQDCGEWALPGGMVDPGEQVSQTLKREFMEEALSTSKDTSILDAFFKSGTDIYKGYVDDPRNTDNAWMETVAVNFHDERGDIVADFKLHAGDDAAKVKWMDVNKSIKLYASHVRIVEKVVQQLDAHW